ncbi:MAG: methyl-accepting chemotaxis protein [Candidatus Omnitrophica bacterium]|nr:methyl-accepting chemotaxis protein [Candidatus Omnitrophota bacterium]
MTQQQNAFKRRRYLVKRSLQIKYVALVLFFAFLVAFLTGYTIFQTSWTFLGEKLAQVYPQGQLIDILKTTNAIVLFNLALLTPIIIIFSLIFSHRIAGPLYRLERVLWEVSKGNFNVKMYLRRKDELKDIAEIVNVTTENLKNLTDENKQRAEKALREYQGCKEYIASLDAYAHDVRLQEQLRQLEEALIRLNDEFAKYVLE